MKIQMIRAMGRGVPMAAQRNIHQAFKKEKQQNHKGF